MDSAEEITFAVCPGITLISARLAEKQNHADKMGKNLCLIGVDWAFGRRTGQSD